MPGGVRARCASLARLLAACALLLLVATVAAQRGALAEDAAPAPAGTVLEEVAGAEEALEGGHTAAAEQGGAGMPQLDATTYASQIFWLIVTFGVLFWLLSRKALPRVAEILEARQDRIAADLDRAAELRAEAETAERKHAEVVAEAQARAQTQMKEVADRLAADMARRLAALDAELAAKLKEAEARIAASRDTALAELRDVAIESARVAARRLAGIEVDRAAAAAALDRVTQEAA
jgi:F-type H+-transporting ATPase subunit b